MNIDLTTAAAARRTLASSGIALNAVGALLAPVYDPLWAPKQAFKLVQRLVSPGEVKRRDAELIERVIEAGAKNGADEMTVKIRKDQAAGLHVPGLGKESDAEVTVGTSGETTIEFHVKYRQPVAA